MCIPEISLSLFTEMRLGSRIQSESESDTVALATAGTKRKGQELALSWRARLHGVQKMLQQREKLSNLALSWVLPAIIFGI